VLSTDQENDPDILGTLAVSAALTISEIPFQGPVAAVRVGRIDGQFVVNPTFSQLQESELDLVVSGTRDAIMMVEAGAKILPEDVMAEAILFAHRELPPLIGHQVHGLTDKDVAKAPNPHDAATKLREFAGDVPLVGHNVGFDLGFLEEAIGDGFRFAFGTYYDSLAIVREAYPDLDKYTLTDV